MSSSPRSRARFDSLLFRAWAQRLAEAEGARLQKIHQPEALTLVLRLYPSPEGLPLLLRARGGDFLGWADPEQANPATPPAFCMLLRKHLEGAFLREATMPSLDRCLHLVFERKDAEGALRRCRLVFELLGTRANFHLVAEDGALLGSAQRYPTDRDRFGHPRRYAAPPLPGDRLEVGPGSREALQEILAASPDAATLSRQVTGLTRPLASLALRTEDPIDFLLGVLAPSREDGPGPHFQLVEAGDRPLALVGDLPVDWPEGVRTSEYPDLDQLTRAAFLEASREDRQERSRRECRKAVRSLRERLERQLEKNRQGREECSRVGELRAIGELLKVNLGQIQRGSRSITLTDWSSGEAVEQVVSLDPKRSPRANMDHYFQRAKRLDLKLPMLERKARHLERELEHARELEVRLLAPELDPLAFKEELRDLGVLDRGGGPGKGKPAKPGKGKAKKGRKEKKKRELRTFVSSDGLRILVGRSNEENDYLVRRAGKKGDAWLHAEGVSGAHVLVKLAGRMERPPAKTLTEAAQLAAHFSHSRYEGKARIMLSRIGVVKKAPGAGPGQVLVPEYETLVVATDPGILRRLSPLGSGRTSR